MTNLRIPADDRDPYQCTRGQAKALLRRQIWRHIRCTPDRQLLAGMRGGQQPGDFSWRGDFLRIARRELVHRATTLGEDHPMVNHAIDALTLRGQVPAEEIPLDRAARMLSTWTHNPGLTDRERVAILARFPMAAGARLQVGTADYRRRLDAWDTRPLRGLDEPHPDGR